MYGMLWLYLNGLFDVPTPSEASNLENEAEYWAGKLRTDELDFANLVLNKALNGYNHGQCYKLTHPKYTGVGKSVQAIGWRMANSYHVAGYMQAMRHEAIGDTIMGLEELKEDLTIQIRGYDWLFDGVVYWEDTPTGRMALVDNLDEVPAKLRRYVNGHQYHIESESYELHLRQYAGKESDKNKARELLAKMQGGLIERKEVNLTGAIVASQLDKEMSDDEAAALYKQTMRKG